VHIALKVYGHACILRKFRRRSHPLFKRGVCVAVRSHGALSPSIPLFVLHRAAAAAILREREAKRFLADSQVTPPHESLSRSLAVSALADRCAPSLPSFLVSPSGSPDALHPEQT
jgi:hypothetical protein